MLRIKSQSLNDFTILIGSFCIEYIRANAQLVERFFLPCIAKCAMLWLLLPKRTVSISISFVFVLAWYFRPIRLPQRESTQRKRCVFYGRFCTEHSLMFQMHFDPNDTAAVVKYLSRAFSLSLCFVDSSGKIHCRNTIMILGFVRFYCVCAAVSFTLCLW